MNIKHTLRDILIWSIHYSGVSLYYRTQKKKRGPLVRVITFHDVKDAQWFDTLMKGLKKRFHIISPQEFESRTFEKNKINILITFDDGYKSWRTVCAGILHKHNIKALFFVCSGLLSISEDTKEVDTFMKEQLMISPKAALSWDDARYLQKEGHTIGGHTVHHKNLARLSSQDITKEIEDDKATIEKELGAEISSFAYPFGKKFYHYADEAYQCAVRSGYTRIYTADTGFFEENNIDIPRTLIENNQSFASVSRWIQGGYDIFSQIKKACVR